MTVKKMIELRHLKEWTKVDTAKMLEINLRRYDRIERGVNNLNKIRTTKNERFIGKI